MLFARLTLAIALACAFERAAAPSIRDDSADLRVMSFNIRYGTAEDGENAWSKRKELLLQTIEAFDPDLLGTQETLAFQRDFLADELDGYEVVAAGRDDGKERGEMCALYFKKSRFERLDAGHFWLSETPTQPGSKSWDTALTRMCTWVTLRDRRQPRARPIALFNTHFDHKGTNARLESARLLRRRVEESSATCRVIVTGDFNTDAGSEPYVALFEPLAGKTSPVRDTLRVAHPERGEREGTFNGFDVGATGGARIDWIGAAPSWDVVRAEIDRTTKAGRAPSDHFPVTAVLEPTPAADEK